MGKQSRRKKERPAGEAKAVRYLGRLGLPDHPDPTPYRRKAAADPEWFARVRAADDAGAALAAQDDADPAEVLAATRHRYGLICRDLDHALAEYAWRPVMIALAWLRWWYEHHPPATRLLDVGCGPGVLTCAYALALPDAEVVGIDTAPEAVDCARELGRRVGAGNVRFLAGDMLTDLGDVEPFDQLVAVTALADAGLYPYDPPDARRALSSTADVDGPGLAFRSDGVAGLVELVVPGGSMLAFDRTPDPAQAVRFGAALLGAGVDLDLRRSGVEVFIEEGRPTTFTRFAGVRTGGGPATTGAHLAAWLRRVPTPAYGPEWHAELRFEALKAAGARRIWGVDIDYAPRNPVVEQREIWELDDAVYGWVTTTPRHREFVAGRTPEELWREYSNLAAGLAAAGFEVRFTEG